MVTITCTMSYVIICVSMIDSVCPWTYSSGNPIKTLYLLFVVFPRAHSVPRARVRGSKLFWLFYLVGVLVDCFGCVSYSSSLELTVVVTFRIAPRRAR